MPAEIITQQLFDGVRVDKRFAGKRNRFGRNLVIGLFSFSLARSGVNETSRISAMRTGITEYMPLLTW